MNFSANQEQISPLSLETTGFMGNVVLLLRRTNINQTTGMRLKLREGRRQQIYAVTSCMFFCR